MLANFAFAVGLYNFSPFRVLNLLKYIQLHNNFVNFAP
jgi:hypothetical protein